MRSFVRACGEETGKARGPDPMAARRPLLPCLLALAMFPALLSAAPAPRLAFAPEEWKFGMIIQGATITGDVLVTNNEPVAVTVTFVPTCTCVTVTPGSRSIPAGGRAAFSIRYDSIDDRGITTKGYLVTTDLPGAVPLHYLLQGVVRQQRAEPPAAGALTPGRVHSCRLIRP